MFLSLRLIQRQPRRAIEWGIATEFRGLQFYVFNAYGLCPFFCFRVDGVEEFRGGAKDASTENDFLRVEQTDEVCGGHAPEFDGLAEDCLCEGVATVVSGKKLVGAFGCRSAGASGRGSVRVCRGLHFPGDFGEALAGGVVLEATAFNIFGTERAVQGHPANRSGDVMDAAQYRAVNQYTCADSSADCEEDCVAASFGHAKPGFAEDGASAIAVDDDGDGAAWGPAYRTDSAAWGHVAYRGVAEGRLDFAAKRVIFPAGDVGGPNLSGSGMADAWDGDAYGGDPDFVGPREGEKGFDLLSNQFADRAATAALQGNDRPVKDFAAGTENCGGHFGSTQI